MSVVSKRVALCVALLVCLAAAQPCLAAISAGDGHTLIVKPDGTVWAWGQNYAGQLGDGSTTQRTIPTQVSGLTSITAVAAGASHSLALKSDGSVWAWGANDSGQLGIGLTSNVNAPVQISGISNVVAITAGATFSLAVRSDGTVWAWGANDRGQLGNSTGASSGTPIQISGLTNVTAIAAGYAHGLARAIDGAVYAWGNNSSGQLGDGSYQPRTTPVAVASVTDIVAISAGQAFSLALGADGTVWSWGDNGFGQLGGGTGYTRPTPSVIAGLANVASIQAAAYSAYAITNDGTLLDWGVNWNGQLGDGTTNSYTTPTTITTLSSLRELAAGSGFVVAVTTTNQVWSWGANYYGQLGDGTTRQRYLPVAISDAGMVWKVATPTFSPDGGTYEPDLLVFITSATTTATVHYTTDGSEPTESSPVLSPNNGLPLPVSLTIRARAFTNGMPASNEASAIYTLQVARPTATLSGGTYNTPQTLVLQTRTANATIHYTIDGSDPTESSPTYSEPIPVNQSTTVRARAFRNGSDPSDLLFTDIQLQVKPPVPSPQPGTYASAQVVTLTAEADAVIHYTLDFSEPNETSPIYSAPIATSSGPTTIYAKAFRTGWTPSSTMRASYNTGVDTTAPTIVARVRPDPNSAGWNHTPVTVSFDCQDDFADPLQCSPPVSLSTEGAGQVVSGTAQDAAGHTTGTTVTVNIDLTPPTLTLSDPMEGTTTSAASITIHALVADALSGLATPRCNGVPATVDSSGNLTCDVALGKGVNTIVLQTLDVAGNNTSTSLHVTRTGSPTTLTIVPSTVTLRVGQQQRLLARTEFGATPDGLTWSTSDASVVNLVADQPGKIQAVAAGTATITASDGTLSAQAHVTVSADLTLQVGTVLWALQPTVLGRAAWSVHANKIDPDGPDLYMVDQTDDGWFLKGVRSDGVELTREVLPMSPSDSLAQLAGDAFGGVLIRVNHECSPPYEQCVSIIRAGAGDVGAWQYRPASGLSNRFVQNNAGDLFLLEYRLDGAATYFGIPYARSATEIVRLSGRTGNVQSRSVVEPRSFYASLNCEGSSVSENSAELGQLIVGPDDNVYALARSSRLVQNFLNCADFSSEMSASLQLLKLSPDGAITLTPIDQASDSIPVWPNNLAPDGQGGFLAWGSWNVFGTEARPAMYITSDGGHTNLDAPILNPPAIGNDGTAYITTDNGTKAFLPSTQETRWTSPILGTVVAVDANDGAVVQNDQTLYRIDGNGVADAGTTVALRNPQYWSMGVWHGQSTDTFGPAAQQGPMVNDDAFLLRTTDPLNDSASSITAGGNLAGQGQTVKPEVVSYVTENVLRGGPLPWFATDFWNRFKDQVPALKVKRTSLLVENARLFRFFQDIQDETFSLQMASPVQAVGFIGHAVYIPSDDPDGGPRYSVGLEFFDRDLIKLKDPLPLPYGHQWVNKKEGRGEATAWWVEQVRTQIKVVFISSCYVGPQFKSLWNIDDDTQGRALVVPDTQDEVNFDVGGEAWTMISKDLAAGKSIGAAVDHYNLGPGQHWMVIGDRGVKLTPTPR